MNNPAAIRATIASQIGFFALDSFPISPQDQPTPSARTSHTNSNSNSNSNSNTYPASAHNIMARSQAGMTTPTQPVPLQISTPTSQQNSPAA